MPAHFRDGLDPLDWPLRDEAALTAVFVRVGEHFASLHPAERAFVAAAGRKRTLAYSSGRRAARCALATLGIHNHPLVARDGAPVWPDGVAGSLTHSATLAVAVVARAVRWAGVGVDLERYGRVSARIASRVLSAAEREALPDAGWRTALFSAKESVYKAVHPLCGEFLAFRDVEITVSECRNRFTAATTRPCASATRVAAGDGHFCRYAGHWLALFVIAARRHDEG